MTGLYYRTPEETDLLGYSLYYYLNDSSKNSEYLDRLPYWNGNIGWFDKEDITVLEEIKCCDEEKQKLIQEIRRYGSIFVLTEHLLYEDLEK